MATPQRAMTHPPIAVSRAGQPLVWVLWLLVSIAGAVVGALVAWRIRLLVAAPDLLDQALRYVATIAAAVIASGAQWLMLRRYRLDVYWWVPASVVAGLIAGIIVIPAVLWPFAQPPGTVISLAGAIMSSALALGASGVVVGTAQALVLRPSAGNFAYAWIPATVVGDVLAGAASSAISQPLFVAALPAYLALGLLAGTGSFLVAASQAPVLLRLLR